MIFYPNKIDRRAISDKQFSDIERKAVAYGYSLFNADLPIWDKSYLVDLYTQRLMNDIINANHHEEKEIARSYRRHSL